MTFWLRSCPVSLDLVRRHLGDCGRPDWSRRRSAARPIQSDPRWPFSQRCPIQSGPPWPFSRWRRPGGLPRVRWNVIRQQDQELLKDLVCGLAEPTTEVLEVLAEEVRTGGCPVAGWPTSRSGDVDHEQGGPVSSARVPGAVRSAGVTTPARFWLGLVSSAGWPRKVRCQSMPAAESSTPDSRHRGGEAKPPDAVRAKLPPPTTR